jgi:hypothetical protein
MPVFIFLGWIIGLVVGTVAVAVAFLALGFPVPAFLGALSGVLGPFIALLPPWVAVALAMFFLVASTLIAYFAATASIAPLLPAATSLATITFPPPSGRFDTPGVVPVTIAATSGEFFGRGVLIGLSAATNTIVLSLVPLVGPVLAAWAFTVISLTTNIFVARTRFHQGFLGWSGWLFPLSHLATGVGLLLFIVNIPSAFTAFGLAAFAIDWTTGVIETRGGIAGITGFNGGFSLGNFNFLVGTAAAPAAITPGRFTSPSVSSHETGHTLNTAAMGGIVLWINAIDENIAPGRMNLAYGELTAEGHARNMPGAPRTDYSLRLWF